MMSRSSITYAFCNYLAIAMEHNKSSLTPYLMFSIFLIRRSFKKKKGKPWILFWCEGKVHDKGIPISGSLCILNHNRINTWKIRCVEIESQSHLKLKIGVLKYVRLTSSMMSYGYHGPSNRMWWEEYFMSAAFYPKPVNSVQSWEEKKTRLMLAGETAKGHLAQCAFLKTSWSSKTRKYLNTCGPEETWQLNAMWVPHIVKQNERGH
jgi:hypothetical protein